MRLMWDGDYLPSSSSSTGALVFDDATEPRGGSRGESSAGPSHAISMAAATGTGSGGMAGPGFLCRGLDVRACAATALATGGAPIVGADSSSRAGMGTQGGARATMDRMLAPEATAATLSKAMLLAATGGDAPRIDDGSSALSSINPAASVTIMELAVRRRVARPGTMRNFCGDGVAGQDCLGRSGGR
jgi:hypothetical protein